MRKPKGILIIIGGHEDKGNEEPDIADINKEYEKYEILKAFLDATQKKDPRVEVIPTASNIPGEVGEVYKKIFKKLGMEDVGVMNIKDRIEANSYEFIERIKKADAVLFSGGDQFRLSTILGCSKVVNILYERYVEEHIVVAGTSAGAMAMSKIMLYEGHSMEALLKGDVKTSSGLGFLDHCIIDTHFMKRGRFGRLAQAVVTNPACVGIGLGEDTALAVKNGNEMQCFGSGMVIIIDGSQIKHTNIAETDENTPICIENLVVHVLAKGNGFELKERKFVPKKKHPEVKEEEVDMK